MDRAREDDDDDVIEGHERLEGLAGTAGEPSGELWHGQKFVALDGKGREAVNVTGALGRVRGAPPSGDRPIARAIDDGGGPLDGARVDATRQDEHK